MKKQYSLENKLMVICLLLFVIIYLGTINYQIYIGFPAYQDNCESILSMDENFVSPAVADCIKTENHPFINYWMEFILILPVFLIFNISVIGLTVYFMVNLRILNDFPFGRGSL